MQLLDSNRKGGSEVKKKQCQHPERGLETNVGKVRTLHPGLVHVDVFSAAPGANLLARAHCWQLKHPGTRNNEQ